MNDMIMRELKKVKLLPLYTATDLSILPVLKKILIENKLNLIEITYRSDKASEAINYLSQSNELIVGAGTVRTVEQAEEAVRNGARFIVSPALSMTVVEYCLKSNIPVFPGVATPGEIQRAVEYGLRVVKFFPADIYGGLKAIKALSGPFYDVEFLPTGGINKDNMSEYLEQKNIIAVGGSFIISEAELKKDNGKSADKNLKEVLSQID